MVLTLICEDEERGVPVDVYHTGVWCMSHSLIREDSGVGTWLCSATT